jgi:hypothetical protein
MALVSRGFLAVGSVVLTLLSPPALEPADAPRPSEYEVKAAFLYNFAKFVKWPDDQSPGPTFVIAVLGEDPFGEVLDKTLAGKTILEKKVEVKRFESVGAASKAQILFVSSSEKTRLAEILKALESASVLTVGESDGFTERGGMIAFTLRSDVVRFDINLDQVERARLKMSSQLIRLAQQVISKGDD